MLTTASFAVTLLTFTFTIVGVQRTVRIATRVAASVQARYSGAIARLSRGSAAPRSRPGAVLPAPPAPAVDAVGRSAQPVNTAEHMSA